MMHAEEIAATFGNTIKVFMRWTTELLVQFFKRVIKCAQTVSQKYVIDNQNFYRSLFFKETPYHVCNSLFDATLISRRKRDSWILFCLTCREVTEDAWILYKNYLGDVRVASSYQCIHCTLLFVTQCMISSKKCLLYTTTYKMSCLKMTKRAYCVRVIALKWAVFVWFVRCKS